MASLSLLIPVALLFVIIAIGLFLWAVKNKQFEDLEKEGQSILFDEDLTETETKSIVDTSTKSNKQS